MSGPSLEGVRIVDLTQFLAGPYATQMLADLGAEVIKVESPEGDLARAMPPHFVGEDSVYYHSVNRNKRSVVANLKTSEGIDVVRRLILASDIVIENYRPGVLDRLGIRATQLRAEKPALVWCAISGFGQTGPYRDKPAYDMIVQALSGGMSLTGEVEGKSVRAGIPLGDICAGMYAVAGVLAALHRVTLTGQGDTIDISMLDCQAAMLSYQAAYYLASGNVPKRQGREHDSIATYRAFTGGDERDFVVTANTERMWGGLCRAIGREDLTKDPRFLTNRERHANRHELIPLLNAEFRKKTVDQWVALLEREEVPVGVVNTIDRVIDDPQINARNMILKLDDGHGHSVRVIGSAFKMEHGARADHSFPPIAGQDSAEILREVLGLDDEAIAGLVEKGVIGGGRTPARRAGAATAV